MQTGLDWIGSLGTNMKKSNDMSMSEQVADMLRSGIRSGDFPPGSRLPGERNISRICHVCRATVVAALDILVKENLICKIPSRGNFVLDHTLLPKILLVYPENELGKASCHENAASFWEFYRGLLDGAAACKIGIAAACITENDLEKDLDECLERVSGFDVIIFASEQLLKLRQALYGKKVLIVRRSLLPDQEREPGVSVVSPDYGEAFRLIAEKTLESGYDSLFVLTLRNNSWFTERSKHLRNAVEKAGVSFEERVCRLEQLTQILPELRDKFVFFNNTVDFGSFYYACMRSGFQPGWDFLLTGLCSGSTIINLIPEPSYIKIPHYELGQEAFRLALKKSSDQIVQVPPVFIENMTTERKK